MGAQNGTGFGSWTRMLRDVLLGNVPLAIRTTTEA
ncbi:hypothetical protein J2X37_001770 [Croceicoccus sp. BE223]|nr:hypothetical protein [Croceicoccus sp. BE223]